MHFYFVDDPEYFDREQLYGVAGKDYPDNAERYAEFCGAAIEFCKRVWMPDVIHCHDWQTGLVPVLMRTRYAEDSAVRELPVVFTIHNMGYHGAFPPEPPWKKSASRKACSALTPWNFTGVSIS